MIRLGEAMMILELHRQGLSVTAIARRTGRDPKTVRKYIERGVEVPAYGPRKLGRPCKIAPYMDFLRERVTAFPDLTASRLTREIREMGYSGAYTAVKRYLAAIRPEHDPKPYEVRFETRAGVQGQVDFARFVVEFTDEPGVVRIVWLFSLVLGYSRFLFARYVLHQDLQTLLRCHMQAFEALGGVPIEILYDRMKTAVTGEDDQGHIFLGRSFRNMEDLNAQLIDWLDTVANARVHGTTQRVVTEAFAEELEELQRLPEHRFNAVLKLERRVSHDGLVAVGGNYYSVPDRTRRVVEIEQLPDLVRIIDRGIVVAEHPVLEGRRQYRIDRHHRMGRPTSRPQDRPMTVGRIGDHVLLRSLAVYEAIGASLAMESRP